MYNTKSIMIGSLFFLSAVIGQLMQRVSHADQPTNLITVK